MWGSLVLLLRNKLDHIVDSQDGNGSLSCKSQGVNLGNHWLQNSCLQVVPWGALGQVQTAVLELQSLWLSLTLLLGGGVQGSQLRN